MAKNQKELQLSEEDLEDVLIDAYEMADFNTLYANVREGSECSIYWKMKADKALMHLQKLGIPAELFHRYMEMLDDNCDLRFESVSYILKNSHYIKVQIVVASKHVTEGGRIAENISDMNVGRFDTFNADELKLLAPVTFSVLVEHYDDDADEEIEDEVECIEEEDEVCFCPDCVADRKQKGIPEPDLSGDDADEAEDDEDDPDMPNKTIH